ncbi:hypothetical protein [Bradyrhizobium sp. CCGUVB23]|uniref:hypothetical protein n=1 Tax=Bradyrhizobium sp. CCGUVB23 TaxID=2949630 RepID=UPI0020B33D0C|nr:hypothetical protein [Bradyrhizobium sp. CCGUVB23]MCP3460573.1 hypothetical protein [Bradyrhizobium sp. CCGUVB23]
MKYRKAFLKRKRLMYVCGAAIIICSTRPALAADALEAVMQGCTAVKDDKVSLLCFDKAAATLKAVDVLVGPETANTKEIVTNFSPNDFKVVDPDDLHVAPEKFIGKPIEIRNVSCFYADRGDYRCAPSRGMITVVFAKSIEPAAERETLEHDCGVIKRIASPACRRNIRIVPADYAEDSPSAFAKRIVVKVKRIEVLPASRPTR